MEDNPVLFTDPSGLCTNGIGFDQMLAGANSDFFHGGGQQILAGLNANWQECQQNWNKAQTAWGRGDYGRAVAYATGFNSDLQRAAGWVNDNNRDWDILRDSGCNETVREAAGKRIFGRGFDLAWWLVGTGIVAKKAVSKLAVPRDVLNKGEIVNRVWDDRWTLGSRKYSGPFGGSYSPGSYLPIDSATAVRTRGLNVVSGVQNNAKVGGLFEAIHDIPVTRRMSIGGTEPEVLIEEAYRGLLRLVPGSVSHIP